MSPKAHVFVTKLAVELQTQGIGAMPSGAVPEDALAAAPDIPELVTFVGYLGGTVTHQQKSWRLLYIDTRLQTCLLVEDAKILYAAKVHDDAAPGRERDVIWVTADTSVGRGSGSQSVEARFLTGDFTTAGNFEAPPAGGTLAAATGVFCEAKTPSCCRRRSQS